MFISISCSHAGCGFYLECDSAEGQLATCQPLYMHNFTPFPGDNITSAEVRNELDALNYRKVRPRYRGFLHRAQN